MKPTTTKRALITANERQLHRSAPFRHACRLPFICIRYPSMTNEWEIHTADGYKVITKPGPEILEEIKKGLEKGTVTVNGKRVRIIQRDGRDAWEYAE